MYISYVHRFHDGRLVSAAVAIVRRMKRVTTFLSCVQAKPSMTSWCARHAASARLVVEHLADVCPNVYPAPAYAPSNAIVWVAPKQVAYGPSCGTSVSVLRHGCGQSVKLEFRPPCGQNIWFSIIHVSGNESNRSVKYFHTFAFPYFLRHSS